MHTAILPHSFSATMCYRQVQCALHSICGHQEPRAHSTVSVPTYRYLPSVDGWIQLGRLPELPMPIQCAPSAKLWRLSAVLPSMVTLLSSDESSRLTLVR